MITVLEHKLNLLLTKQKQHTQPDWQPQEHGVNHMNMSGWIITSHAQSILTLPNCQQNSRLVCPYMQVQGAIFNTIKLLFY